MASSQRFALTIRYRKAGRRCPVVNIRGHPSGEVIQPGGRGVDPGARPRTMENRVSDHITLEVIDAEGALQEAADNVGPTGAGTRADFFKKAAVGGGALMLGGVGLGGLPSLALGAPLKAQDVAILNYALTSSTWRPPSTPRCSRIRC